MRKQYSKFSVIAVTILNTAIILGVVLWSGTLRERNVYDEHRIKLDSIVLLVNDLSKSEVFYANVLNFSQVKLETSEKIAAFQLPDGQRIFLLELGVGTNEAALHKQSTVVLNLRNRFAKFHKDILSRNGSQAIPLGNTQSILQSSISQSVTEIKSYNWGEEFAVTDPDDNVFVFYTGSNKKSRWALE